MTRPKRVQREAGTLSKSGTVGIIGVVLLLGSGLSWAGPPNPTPSDNLNNTAGGTAALGGNTTGVGNSGFGAFALEFNTTGTNNSAFGRGALDRNVMGNDNTAFGTDALFNTTGDVNSAFGAFALSRNTMGTNNSAVGVLALFSNVTGNDNSAFGARALFNNTTGFDNTASGPFALEANTQGVFNTAVGSAALNSNTTGGENTALGGFALSTNIIGDNNTAIGWDANIDCGNFSCSQVYIHNSTALGNEAAITDSNQIVLGNDQITKIFAKVTNISGISDRRRKKEIRALDDDLGLDLIEKLQPVSYRFNNGDETERYGFIAQDLEQALPASLQDTIERSEPEHGLALIERQNDKDRTYRVSYGELTAPIVKAIQQQQQEIEAERQQNAELRHALEDQAATFKAENDALRHSIAALREQVTAAR